MAISQELAAQGRSWFSARRRAVPSTSGRASVGMKPCPKAL
ncbi:MAG: hypothetical protein ACRDXD_01450 [Acidimicrobiia bacterium]